MLNAPDPALLQTFVAIVESGSFTDAAKRVHRTQSAVSMQIRRLEVILGHPVFERNGRAIRLTGAGEVFYDYARRILEDYQSAMAALGQEPIEGDVAVGAPDDYTTIFLPEILASFRRTHPQARIHIISEPSRQLLHELSIGSIDVALLTEGEGSMGGTVVHREPLVWVSSDRHRTHERDPVPLAVFHSGDVFRRCAVARLEENHRRVSIAVTSSSFAGIAAAVQSGVAVAAIFEGSVCPGMRVLTPREGYPELTSVGIVMQRSDKEPHELADRFGVHAVETLRSREARRTRMASPR